MRIYEKDGFTEEMADHGPLSGLSGAPMKTVASETIEWRVWLFPSTVEHPHTCTRILQKRQLLSRGCLCGLWRLKQADLSISNPSYKSSDMAKVMCIPKSDGLAVLCSFFLTGIIITFRFSQGHSLFLSSFCKLSLKI